LKNSRAPKLSAVWSRNLIKPMLLFSDYIDYIAFFSFIVLDLQYFSRHNHKLRDVHMSIFGKTITVFRTIVTSLITIHQNMNIKRFSHPSLPLVFDSSSARAILYIWLGIANRLRFTSVSTATKACY
jgi:hypothetical protein